MSTDSTNRSSAAKRPALRAVPHLRRALAGDENALAALVRLEAAFAQDGVLAEVVDAYGRRWAKDGTYYEAVEALTCGAAMPFDECANCGANASENVTWNPTGGWTCAACGESDYPEAAE